MPCLIYFEDTIEDIENRFLANPEDVSFLVGIIIELYNLIENTIDVTNRRRLNSLKTYSKTTIL